MTLTNQKLDHIVATLKMVGALDSATASPAETLSQLYGKHTAPIWLSLTKRYATLKKRYTQNLLGNYTGQQTEASCSAASLAIIINTMQQRCSELASKAAPRISEQDLTSSIELHNWKARTGHNLNSICCQQGVTLEQLLEITQCALDHHKIAHHSVTTLKARTHNLKRARKLLQTTLERVNSDRPPFLLAHFVPREILPTYDAGSIAHISPIGGYNPARRELLILDVYSKLYEPYWVPVEDFFRAIYRETDCWGEGGLIVIDR
jgi:hypothetical protein